MAKKKVDRAARAAFAQLGKQRYVMTHERVYPCLDPDWKPVAQRLTYDEMMMVSWIVVMAQSMRSGLGRIMKDRLHAVPKGQERFDLATEILLRLSDDIQCTMLSGQLITLDNMCRNGQIKIELKNATATPNMTAVVRCNEMMLIGRAAQQGECALCMRQGSEIRACELRKAFDECGLCSAQYDENLGCHYRNRPIDLDYVEME